MKLSEALAVLLEAEDRALEMKNAAEREARDIIRKAQERFAQDSETRLAAAHEEARTQVEAAKQAAEMDALHVAQLAQRSRERMREHFDKKAPDLVAAIAEELAARYVARGQHACR